MAASWKTLPPCAVLQSVMILLLLTFFQTCGKYTIKANLIKKIEVITIFDLKYLKYVVLSLLWI